MKSIKELQDLIEKEIKGLKFEGNPQNLYDPINYIMSLGGKRMRPLLVLLAYQLQKKNVEEALKCAVAVEVFHNFTLMHDDIMDEAPLRRGKLTVHKKWNANVAILSGDTMLVKAYSLFLNMPTAVLSEALSLFNKCAAEVCEGQQIDMNFETRSHVHVEEYLNMIRLKTAVLLGFSMELGALLGGATEEDRKKIYDFGVNMGLGFQLMDDLLDVYGDRSKFGKQVGGDIVSNKKTYLLINAMEQASDEQKSTLEGWLATDEFVVKEKVSAVKFIYDQLRIKEQTVEKINEYFDFAFAILDEIQGDERAKVVLKDFATSLINRDS